MALNLGINSPRLNQRALFKEHKVDGNGHKEPVTLAAVRNRGVTNPSFETDADENHVFSIESNGNASVGYRQCADGVLPAPVDDTTKSHSNQSQRNRILRTILLLSIYCTTGLLYGQMGPTLPDLQRLSGTPLEKASWIFTGFAIGYLVGCLIGGILLEKLNVYLLLFMYTFGNAVVNIILPWIPEFIVMVINRFVLGIFIGGQDTAVHTTILMVWAEQGGRFIHITHTLAALGGVVSPLITEPFVSSSLSSNDIRNYTSNETILSNNGTMDTNATHLSEDLADSSIHYAFLITGILAGLASLPALYICVKEKAKPTVYKTSSEDETNSNELLPAKIKNVVLVVLYVNSFMATATMDMFPGFLTTFLIRQLQWTQNIGTICTAIYFGTYGLGNLIAAGTYSLFSTTTLVAISYVGTTVVMGTMVVGVVFTNDILTWLSLCLIGLTTSVLVPVLFAWTQSNVTPVTGRIASAFLFSGSAGIMANPLLLGYLMDNYTPMWYLYCSLGEITICAFLFVLAYGLVRMYSFGKLETVNYPKSLEVTVVQKDQHLPPGQISTHL